MPIPEHLRTGDLRVWKLCVGPLENNVYVAASAATGRAVVIDASDEADRIVGAAEGLEPVAILTTHGHHDHVGAAAEVAARLDVPALIHPDDVPIAGNPLEGGIADGAGWDLGGVTVRAMHTPGHTPGSTCFVVDGAVFTGDALFPGGPGATGGPEQFTTAIDSIRDRLFTLPDETLVLPGHGLDTTIGDERPRLEEWVERGW